jgi:hypothetical protein
MIMKILQFTLPPKNDENNVSGNYTIYIKQASISEPQLEGHC